MKQLSIILFLIFCLKGYSQPLDSLRLVRIADSIIETNTSADLLKYLTRSENHVSESRRIEQNNENERIIYQVNYQIMTKSGNQIRVIVDTTIAAISYGVPIIKVEIDTNYSILDTPDFDALIRIYNRIFDADLIDKQTAIKLAQPYSQYKNGKFDFAALELNLQTDKIYWLIYFNKGKRKVNEEQILIDAENSVFLKRRERKYRKVLTY